MERINTQDGRFAAGNPQNGTPGTMVTSEYMNNVQDELCNVIEQAGLELDGEDTQQLLKAIRALIFANAPMVLSTTPTTQQDADLIFVMDRLQFKSWVAGVNYTGYRSLNCGNITGVMRLDPPPGMMAAEGDIFDGAEEPALVGIYKDNGLVVPIADWEPGTGFLGDMGDGTYRAPDVRNMFLRFSGTDADTANARALGSMQLQAVQELNLYANIAGPTSIVTGGTISNSANITVGSNQYNRTDMGSFSVGSGSDTRPGNSAFNPVICL